MKERIAGVGRVQGRPLLSQASGLRIVAIGLTIVAFASPAFAESDQYQVANHLAASQTLFDHARQIGERFVVQIETVGGAQPLNRLPQDEDEKEDPQAPDRNLFRDSPGSSFLVADGPTTGIIYSADGLILTSSFNFIREPSVVTVRLPDGRQVAARILGRDQVRKLTLLKVDVEGLPTPEWAPKEQIRVGQWALALGRGLGGGQSSVSAGIISALNRMAGNAIQTDAKLSPVNYGGPLLDGQGRVLGICVPMAQRPGELAGIELYDAGVGFAVPGWRVEEIVADLRAGKSFYRGWLGMQLDPQSKENVRILRMADPSPMLSAGAESGDLIVEVNGTTIEHFGDLVKALYMIPAGERVHVKLLRGADFVDVEVTLARSEELGTLPPVEEPFDPSQPTPEEESQEPAPMPD